MSKIASRVLALVKSPHFLAALVSAAVLLPLGLVRAVGLPFEGLDIPEHLAQDTDIRLTALNVVNYILLAAGIIAVLFLIVGGIQYVVSHGNEDLREKAKQTVTYAIMGVVVILISYVVVVTVGKLLEG